MLELHISDTNITHSSATISWCVSKDILQECIDKEIKDPQLVICTSPKEGYHIKKEYRKVVPLKDLMAYVEFHCAGQNNIWGYVCLDSAKFTKTKYLAKDDGEYKSWFLSEDGSNYVDYLVEDPERKPKTSAPITVDVPKEYFAKEPSQWDKAWTNWLFRSRPIDQCNYRRRRMFAYSIQLIIMLLFYIFNLGALLFASIIGARNISLKFLLHPLTYSLEDACYVWRGGTYFIRKNVKDCGDDATFMQDLWWLVRKAWTLPFMPAIAVPLFLLFRSGHLLRFSIVFFGVILAAIIITALASGIMKDFYEFVMDKLLAPEQNLDEKDMDLLMCDGNVKPLKLSQLPANKRTIKLRFYDLKSKVCRPFSR